MTSMRLMFGMIVLVVGLSGIMYAANREDKHQSERLFEETIATGAIDTVAGDDAVCMPSNVSPTDVTLISVRILDFAGSDVQCCSSCTSAFPAGRTCFSLAHITSGTHIRCEITFAEKTRPREHDREGGVRTSKIRGTLQ